MAVTMLIGDFIREWNAVMGAAPFVTVPPPVLFLALQRDVVAGLVSGPDW